MRNIIITILSAFIIGAQAYGQVEHVVTGTGNVFNLAYPANVTALTPGLSFTFKSNQSITGPASLAVNGLAAVSIKKEVSQNLIANDILNNQIVTVVYDGTNFQMVSKMGNPGGGASLWTDSGSETYLTNTSIPVAIGLTTPNTLFKMHLQSTIEKGLYVDNAYGGTNSSVGLQIYSNNGFSGTRYGIYAEANGGSSPGQSGYGGFFSSTVGNTGSTNYGIYAQAAGGATNYAGYFGTGNVYVQNTLILPTGAGAGKVLTSDATGNASWQAAGGADSHIQDLGGNTFIETDAIGDGTGDVIDFNLGGTQHFQMDGARLEVLNSGGNVLIGEGAGVATSTGTNNVSMGTSSGTANTTGFGNVNVGYETDMTRITTNGNTSVGYQAGRSGTTGNYSTMVGFQAGMNSSSERSTLIGYQAGLNNTGNYTVAIGYGAGSNNTFFDPVYIGRFAGYNNTSGQNNVAIGAYSLNANITSGYNVAVGYGTLRNNTASWNTAVGNNALNSNVTGTENAAFGTDALIDNTSSNNSAFGSQALRSTTSGQRNTSSGYYSLRGNTIGNYNTALGAYAGDLNTTGSSNTLIGYQADVAANNLTNATAIGANSSVGQSNSLILGGTGASAVNVGIGTTTPAATLDITGTDAIVLPQGTTGERPGTPEQGMLRFNADLTTFEGYDGTVWTDLVSGGSGWSLAGNSGTVDGTDFIGTTDNVPFNFKVNNQNAGKIDHILLNTFMGHYAGLNTTGNLNSAFGEQALLINSTGTKNTAVGALSSYTNSTGIENTAIGVQALYTNSTGNQNNAMGYYSLAFSTGSQNSAVGNFSLGQNTSGDFNTALGNSALYNNLIGDNNTAIGYNSGVSVDGLNNATAIGANASVATSNSLVLGNGANVGIGTSSPSSKLEVNGDMSIMGDSFRFKRGGSGGDMIAVAYGVINDGVKQVNASEGDFTVAKIAAGHYRVSFTGARTFTGFGEFAVMLTVVDQTGGASPLLASYNYFAPQTFDIYLNDLAPTPTDGIVSFELRVK